MKSSDWVVGAERDVLSPAQWRIILLASLGGALEFYDFIIYGVFASSIAATFFPGSDALLSLILTYAVFAIGYLARPVGGIVLSQLGDRHGRRRVFIASVLAISFSTIAMGLLPGYAVWGRAAPVLLLSLRLLQGFCLGGELPGAVTYVAETAPRRAGLGCGIVYCCVNSGVLAATLVSLLVNNLLPSSAVVGTGWRIGFLLGGGIGLLSFQLRRSLDETPAFTAVKLRHAAARHPFRDVLTRHPRAVLVGVLTSTACAGYNGLLFAHMPSYLVRVLHDDAGQVARAENLAVAVVSAGLLLVGWASDHVSRRRLLQVGSVLMAVSAVPFYVGLSGHWLGLLPIMALLGVPNAFCAGTFASILAGLFPTEVRFSGVALALNISFTLFSGTAPLVATWLISTTGWVAAPGLLMAGCGLASLVGSFGVARSREAGSGAL